MDDLHLVWNPACLCGLCLWDWGTGVRVIGVYLGFCICSVDAKDEEYLGSNSVSRSLRFSLVYCIWVLIIQSDFKNGNNFIVSAHFARVQNPRKVFIEDM